MKCARDPASEVDFRGSRRFNRIIKGDELGVPGGIRPSTSCTAHQIQATVSTPAQQDQRTPANSPVASGFLRDSDREGG